MNSIFDPSVEFASLRRLLAHDYPERNARLREWLRRTTNHCDLWLKVLVVAIAMYLAIEIGWAFLPGHAVARVLRGGR